LVWWPLTPLLASTSFGVGIGVTFAAPVVFYLLLPASKRRTQLVLVLCIVAAAIPFMYRGLVALHRSMSGSLGATVQFILLYGGLDYHGLIGLMLARLLEYGVLVLPLGFAALHVDFPGSATGVTVGAFVVALLLAFARSSGTVRRQMLAWVVLALGCYGIIAAGRAMFFLPSIMAHVATQPRYHYVGTIP